MSPWVKIKGTSGLGFLWPGLPSRPVGGFSSCLPPRRAALKPPCPYRLPQNSNSAAEETGRFMKNLKVLIVDDDAEWTRTFCDNLVGTTSA